MMKAYFDFVAGNWMRVALVNPGLTPGELQKELWKEWTGEGEKKRETKMMKKRPRSVEKDGCGNGILGNRANDDIGGKDIKINVSSGESNWTGEGEKKRETKMMKKRPRSVEKDGCGNGMLDNNANDDNGGKDIKINVPSGESNQNSSVPDDNLSNSNDPDTKEVKKLVKSSPSSVSVGKGNEVAREGSDPDSSVPKVEMRNNEQKLCQSSPSTESVTGNPVRQNWVETAYTYFQAQMKEELRRLMPHMGEEDMVGRVRSKWEELSEDLKESFYKDSTKNQ
eukprot:GFUD01020005.1.p1 GENE.GFUD01020005.1~~GFUD01020005.1.p1  ORF type:complete len:281 (+),score=93.87 GFUD01020005.1:534-1376(+)